MEGISKHKLEAKESTLKLINSLIQVYTFEDPNSMVPAISVKDHLETLKELLDEQKQ